MNKLIYLVEKYNKNFYDFLIDFYSKKIKFVNDKEDKILFLKEN